MTCSSSIPTQTGTISVTYFGDSTMIFVVLSDHPFNCVYQNLRTSIREINYLNRLVWVILNIFFNGFVGLIMIIWVSCDMNMPILFFPVLPSSLLQSILQKYLITKISLPKSTLRTFYRILTNLATWVLMRFLQHTSIQLWDILEYCSQLKKKYLVKHI